MRAFDEEKNERTENKVRIPVWIYPSSLVEVSMVMNVLAAGLEIQPESLNALRARCVRDVKKSNGSISFKVAIKLQRGDSEE